MFHYGNQNPDGQESNRPDPYKDIEGFMQSCIEGELGDEYQVKAHYIVSDLDGDVIKVKQRMSDLKEGGEPAFEDEQDTLHDFLHYVENQGREFSFESKLTRSLGIMESSDKPVAFKHEGLKKKSQEGAHRFDKPVDFVQLKHDDQFGTKSEHKSLS